MLRTKHIVFQVNPCIYSHTMHVIDHQAISTHHAQAQICAVHIRFQYDKSKENFIFQKIQGLDHPIFT
jgi:hypothetical protein